MKKLIQTQPLVDGWYVYQTEAEAFESPDQITFSDLPALKADRLPGSLFSFLKQDASCCEIEDFDWWYRCEFIVDDLDIASGFRISFDRLASIAEIWLNGIKLLSSNNMFVPLSADVSDIILENNILVICFRSVSAHLKQRRPRPRWKTNLVKNQQLRWLRTSLLGRIPGWSPNFPALGPCGPIELIRWGNINVLQAEVNFSLEDGVGNVNAKVKLSGKIKSVFVDVGEHRVILESSKSDTEMEQIYRGHLRLENPDLWFPHTHGEAHQYPVKLLVTTDAFTYEEELGFRSFRTIDFDPTVGSLFRVNSLDVFVRGACWTIRDVKRFWSEATDFRATLKLAREAGMNMLRVGGTMSYEQEYFYDICDELGIMVWQDFMFANMDYPVDDQTFKDNIVTEVRAQLERLSNHACIAVYCGNSEVSQQAAMVGMESEKWSNEFFDVELPQLCREIHKGVPYVPSTPYGGSMPFHIGEGICHFYGVGAYKRSLLASGLNNVKFTPETLGFSHVPNQAQIEAIFDGAHPVCHSPVWKRGIPRDSGAGWDFEDIRDFYLRELFGVDPIELRSRDTQRYLAISQAVTGELVKEVIGHWRSNKTPCGGALLWFYQDIVPGAGWGLIDNQSVPKPAYFYIKRAFRSTAAFLIDQGLDGLDALIINESNSSQTLRIELKLLVSSNTIVEYHSQLIELGSNSQWQGNVEKLLGKFRDVNYSYHFGPIQHELVTIQVFCNKSNKMIGEDVFFVQSLGLPISNNAVIDSKLEKRSDGLYLVLHSDVFLQSVCLELSNCSVENNYFHLLPNTSTLVRISPSNSLNDVIKGHLSALNLSSSVRIRVKTEE